MASIRTRPLKPDSRTGKPRKAYLVRWVDPGGVERSKQCRTLDEARAKKSEVEHDLRHGSYVDPRAGRVTFREYAEQWRSIQVHRDGTRDSYERNLRLHVYPVIGDRPLNSIRRSDIQALVKSIDRAPATLGVIFAVVGAIFNAAVLDDVIKKSPCHKITLPRATKPEIVVPTREQAFAVAARASPRHASMLRVALGTGLRQGELAAVSLQSVDFLRRTLTVDPEQGQLVTRDGDPLRLGPPKSAASARTVPLAPSVVEELSRYVEQYGTIELDGRDLVFSTNRGTPLRRQAMTQIVSPLLRAEGFPVGVGMHLFRHFYASALIAREPNAKLIQARMGHATISETFDTYGHLFPESDDLSREAIENVFEAQKKSPRHSEAE